MKQMLRVVAFIVFSSAFVHAQTIADLARRERARRLAAPKAIVITNNDLKTDTSSPKAEPKPVESTAAPAPPAAPATTTGPGGHDEKWWRGEFQKVREDIQRLENQIPLLESNFNTASREFLTRSYDPDGRGKRAIDESKAKMDEAKSNLANARERLPELEEELRRAGGPAGWSR